MPIYCQTCTVCGHLFEQVRPLSEFDKLPPCEKCDGPTEKAYVPSGVSISSAAVVVYKADDGSYRFPGDPDPNSRTAKRYAKLGYERVELHGWGAVRRMESAVTKQQYSEMCQRAERQHQMREISMADRRSEIRRCLEQGFAVPEHDDRGRPTGRMKTVRFGAQATDLMRAAMAKNDRKPQPRAQEPGCFVEVYSMDRSNRDESRRSDGKRFRD